MYAIFEKITLSIKLKKFCLLSSLSKISFSNKGGSIMGLENSFEFIICAIFCPFISVELSSLISLILVLPFLLLSLNLVELLVLYLLHLVSFFSFLSYLSLSFFFFFLSFFFFSTFRNMVSIFSTFNTNNRYVYRIIQF